MLPRLIYSEKDAFIGGRNIFDNMIVAQESMYDLQRVSIRRRLMAIRIDMEREHITV